MTSRVCGVLAVARSLGDIALQPFVSPEPEIHGPFAIDDVSSKITILSIYIDVVFVLF